MKIGALSLFQRTSGRGSVNLASWHSRHSLTWRWVLSAGLQRLEFEGPRATWKPRDHHPMVAFSFGSYLRAFAMRHNGGWQFGLTVLGLCLGFSLQQPMWFRDLYWRRETERYERRAA